MNNNNNKNNKKLKIFILIILIFINYRFFTQMYKKNITVIDISGGLMGKRGPEKFIRGLNETFPYNTYNTRNRRFISSKAILPNNRTIIYIYYIQ